MVSRTILSRLRLPFRHIGMVGGRCRRAVTARLQRNYYNTFPRAKQVKLFVPRKKQRFQLAFVHFDRF